MLSNYSQDTIPVYYVYVYLDADLRHVRYVGSGTGRRAWNSKKHIYFPENPEQIRIVSIGLTKAESLRLEQYLIDDYGLDNLENRRRSWNQESQYRRVARGPEFTGKRGIAKKWQPLLDAVHDGLLSESDFLISDELLLDLCPFLESTRQIKNAKNNLKKRGSLEKGLGSRGLEVSVEVVRHKGIMVSLAA